MKTVYGEIVCKRPRCRSTGEDAAVTHAVIVQRGGVRDGVLVGDLCVDVCARCAEEARDEGLETVEHQTR